MTSSSDSENPVSSPSPLFVCLFVYLFVCLFLFLWIVSMLMIIMVTLIAMGYIINAPQTIIILLSTCQF